MARYKVFDSMPESRDEEGPEYEASGHGAAAVEWAKAHDEDEVIARGEPATVYVLRAGDPTEAAFRFRIEGTIRITYQVRVAW